MVSHFILLLFIIHYMNKSQIISHSSIDEHLSWVASIFSQERKVNLTDFITETQELGHTMAG
jgi:hypothetical protein